MQLQSFIPIIVTERIIECRDFCRRAVRATTLRALRSSGDLDRCRRAARICARFLLGIAVSLPATVATGQSQPLNQGSRLAAAASQQVGVTKLYDPSYRKISFPGGDVPIDRGVCSDVVIRAFRAIEVDLQFTVYEDMRRHFRRYPQLWKLRRPDPNIDHRRVPNLMVFFEREGKSLALTAPYEPGDVVAWRLPNGLHHIGVVAQARASAGHHLMVHNIGAGTQLEDVLHSYKKIGHYRW